MNITHSITTVTLMIVFYSLDTLEIWIIHNLWEKNLCLYRKDTWMLSIVCNICASRASIIKYVYSRPLRLLKGHMTCNQFANWNRMHYLGPYLFSLVKCHELFCHHNGNIICIIWKHHIILQNEVYVQTFI